MDGVFLRKVVTTKQLEMLLKAEFVELRIETESSDVGYTMKLYPMETIKKYFK